jgi:hypothetical protein
MPRTARFPIPRLLLTFALLAPPASAVAQSAFPFLLELPGETVGVRYAPGSLERASLVQAELTQLARDLGSWTGTESKLWVYLIDRQGWLEAGLDAVFGLPVGMGGGGLALPAWGDAETVELWQRALGSELPRIEAPGWRGTPEEAASLEAADLAALSLAALDLIRAAGFWGDEPWVEGVTAHLAALSSLRRRDPTRAARLERLFAGLLSRPAPAQPAAGDSGERSPTGRLLSQAALHEAARRVVERRGPGAAKEWLKPARKRGGRIEAARLLKREPELRAWMDARRGQTVD